MYDQPQLPRSSKHTFNFKCLVICNKRERTIQQELYRMPQVAAPLTQPQPTDTSPSPHMYTPKRVGIIKEATKYIQMHNNTHPHTHEHKGTNHNNVMKIEHQIF